MNEPYIKELVLYVTEEGDYGYDHTLIINPEVLDVHGEIWQNLDRLHFNSRQEYILAYLENDEETMRNLEEEMW